MKFEPVGLDARFKRVLSYSYKTSINTGYIKTRSLAGHSHQARQASCQLPLPQSLLASCDQKYARMPMTPTMPCPHSFPIQLNT